MASVTTIFRPDPTCFAPSNLWLNQKPRWGCDTYYPPFGPRPTEILPSLACDFPVLGRPQFYGFEDLCYQSNDITTGATIYHSTAYSACPKGMTGAETRTGVANGITIAATVCCPTAYDFTLVSDRTLIPTVIDGTTYPLTFATETELCKAGSIKALSDQTVTMTVFAGETTGTTTETVWDYENGFIVATAAIINKRLYTDPVASTTSTCYGDLDARCALRSNPLVPGPTPAPSDRYDPPPTSPVTQFTPAPSCLSQPGNLWLVSDQCSVVTTRPENQPHPPWLQCTHILAGEPNPSQTACYPAGPAAAGPSGDSTFYTGCPVGYTQAGLATSKPFDARFGKPRANYAAEASTLGCCPSLEGISFAYPSRTPGAGWPEPTTTHDGVAYSVQRGPPPRCVATGVGVQDALAGPAGRPVTLGLYADDGGRYEGTTEVDWDAASHTLYAHAVEVRYTVFHGTYTCFRNCGAYFTHSYNNTQRAASSTGAAAVVARGDVQAGLSVVVVVVTVVHVVMGALV
ncbi:uncharacterized protein B0H64DRAFT_409532 [Chaetomium fimeti]|uniref:Uncharacterized protein n=1 Tax=Chaetomium fimeti TaxID=1854472 RepID=A0AAE0H7W5_9PEZI|nr:hypothetical protein B0H64DRAFT_409532 [Chaetomium fimeti]